MVSGFVQTTSGSIHNVEIGTLNMTHPKSFLLASTFLIVALSSCSGNRSEGPKEPPPTPVIAFNVEPGTATYYDIYPGTVTAMNQVELRPQVSGYISAMKFLEGQHVRKGETLYTIDQQRYQAAYDQAVANRNVARANLDKVKQDVERYSDLAKHDAVARQTLEHARADLQSAKMQLAASEANVHNEETNLRYSVIVAPFDGTIGISQVKLGSAVTAGQTLLNTISSDDPMAVDFAVDEKQIGKFTGLLETKPDAADSTFSIVLPDRSVYPSPGRLSFLDRAVDPQTGTLRARIIIPNQHNILRAGLNCDVRLKSKYEPGSLIIPYKAVVEQMGEYSVFVIDNGRVTQRRINLGMTMDGVVIVKNGLKSGEQIAVEGVQRLREGAPVSVSGSGEGQKAGPAPSK